ncbi:sigma-70 family RNA polymerase sigma factor [Sutcliffiella rhizosphaerae]|uniref:Uncharacterized protein n=1 Tax=Sutcliffiella rhizosphaerae TaxID=2880967 RepID=A0ABM8YTL3_9BACI|nr:sigma-70 family RNA polymerase sigma factor [Sutcliffiella rhizosphaerae]CAG9623306.1 hypothetical protein BACCIP111883_04107 [Sutcliffiella rhizosphaerae]
MEENNNLSERDKIYLIEELFTKYSTDIKRIAFLYVKDSILVEDILQEVFISCFINLEKFKGKSSYKTWLLKITANKCRDALKRWSFKNIIYKDTLDDGYKIEETPENIFTTKQEEYLVAIQLLKLPLKYREVIILFYYQELSIEEISNILNININTTKTRLYRGRERFKSLLEESGYTWELN